MAQRRGLAAVDALRAHAAIAAVGVEIDGAGRDVFPLCIERQIVVDEDIRAVFIAGRVFLILVVFRCAPALEPIMLLRGRVRVQRCLLADGHRLCLHRSRAAVGDKGDRRVLCGILIGTPLAVQQGAVVLTADLDPFPLLVRPVVVDRERIAAVKCIVFNRFEPLGKRNGLELVAIAERVAPDLFQ